jgi:lipopolysaccharide/colanic/teichoic acid biosynthesis glycosyltransferase
MNSGMKRKLKRVLDVAVAIAALILLSPLLVLIFLSTRLSMGRPALFRQNTGLISS